MKNLIACCLSIFMFGILSSANAQLVHGEHQVEPVGGSARSISDQVGQQQQSFCGVTSVLDNPMQGFDMYAESRNAFRSMELDSHGRPKKFTMRGKIYEPTYVNDQLSGYIINGQVVAFTTESNATANEPATVFVRDGAGELKTTFSIPKRILGPSGTFIQRELVLTTEAAKTLLSDKRRALASNFLSKQGGDIDIPRFTDFKACFVCDAELAVDLSVCSFVASGLAGLDAALVLAGCTATGGWFCVGFVVLGAVEAAAIYDMFQSCNSRAVKRFERCRGTCT